MAKSKENILRSVDAHEALRLRTKVDEYVMFLLTRLDGRAHLSSVPTKGGPKNPEREREQREVTKRARILGGGTTNPTWLGGMRSGLGLGQREED